LKHDGAVNAVAFSPDGRVLGTASGDRTARQWDVAAGGPVGRPLVHAGPVTGLAYTPDGRGMVTRSKDGKAWLWDLATGKPLAGFFEPDESVVAVAVVPDGRSVLTNSDLGVCVWPVPQPVGGDVERVVLWSRVASGMTLGEDGEVRLLGGAAWRDVRAQLAAKGGPPTP
jgi:WD40 repeat protein